MTAAPMPAPDLLVTSSDGTAIAVFRSGRRDGPPVLLVHGASADHTTWRVLAPLLGHGHDVWAMDRRGRGASGDTQPYAIEREFEDVAAVADRITAVRGVPSIDVVGHSYGGRCALGAALRSPSIGRVVSYEGAPTPTGVRYGDEGIGAELGGLAAAGEGERLLETFMGRVVGMTPAELERYRADPVWPRRVAAAHTIARELAAETQAGADLETLGRVRRPVLQVLGGESRPEFGAATRALDELLADGHVVTIHGAKHAAHHTHPAELSRAIERFLAQGEMGEPPR